MLDDDPAALVPDDERRKADEKWGQGGWVACTGSCPLYSGSVPQQYVIHGKDAHR